MNLFQEFYPFCLLKVGHLEGCKNSRGTFNYDIYLDQGENLKLKIINGFAKNPWLDKLLPGKNPAAAFLAKKVRYLEKKSTLGEPVGLATSRHPMRWAGAGGLVIWRDRNKRTYVILNRRSAKTFQGGKIDAQGGVSSCFFHWLAPKVLGLQEITEELILIRKNKLLLPSLPAGFFDIPTLIKRQKLLSRPFLKNKKIMGVDFIPLKDRTPLEKSDFLTTHLGDDGLGLNLSTRGLVIIDPATGGLDLRNIYEMPIDKMEDVLIIDGENEIGKPTKSRNREMLLFGLDDLMTALTADLPMATPILAFQGGLRIKPQAIRLEMTLVLEKMLWVLASQHLC